MKQHSKKALSAEQRQEVASWMADNLSELPEAVQRILAPHQRYLAADENLGQQFDTTWRELRRALGIIPSSERRRSGHPLTSAPKRDRSASPQDKRAWLEAEKDRRGRLGDWHDDLMKRHNDNAKRIEKKLSQMTPEQELKPCITTEDVTEAVLSIEDIEPTEEQAAASLARGIEFSDHVEQGDEADPALQSVNETLMPGGAVVVTEEFSKLLVEMPKDLQYAKVVQILNEKRVRYEITIAVNRIELDVEKKVILKDDGERAILSASTAQIGPPRYSITWSALATLATLVGQFALPLNRIATMFSTTGKRFTAGGLSRMLHYTAERLLPIYIELSEELADSDILAGDDTSCRVVEVASYFAKLKARGGSSGNKVPWADYKNPVAAEQSVERCAQRKRARHKRRADGDREAKRRPDEEPSLGILLGRVFGFRSPLQDGQGDKQSMNTTVISGRSVAQDPHSLIVFYRSHLGGCGNLLESILQHRSPRSGDVILQADLSTTNLVRDPELLSRFNVKITGCSAHARRPFALYEHEDPMHCAHMLHLFTGLAIHEDCLDVHGRNRENVLAVRQADSRRVWDRIKELATTMADKWSKATKLGTGARYILKHFDKLTAYLSDPRLEPTNNMRERMLRTEKLIEGSSMFRKSLEGRFTLDIVRTLLQTAVASNVPVHEYLESVLRADPDEIAEHPERFTPHAWAARHPAE